MHFSLTIPLLCALPFTLAACGGAGPTPPSPTPAPTALPTPAPVNYAPVISAWQAKLQQFLSAQQLAGMSIAVVDGDRVVWAQGLGVADLASGQPATADTLFRVGSISKLFTATAVMQLVEQQQWQLEQSLPSLLPGFSVQSRFAANASAAQQSVTLRRVLSHHAGLPEEIFACLQQYDAALTRCSQGVELAHRPGEQYAYSNYGVDLLGAALAQHYRQPFTELIRSQVLLPLGMRQSSFAPAIAPFNRYAQAHAGRQAVGYQDDYANMPAGGLWSSANEMSRFLRFAVNGGQLEGQQVLQRASLQQMWQPQNPDTPLDLDCQTGLGWFANECGTSKLGDGWRVVQHGGSTKLFNAELSVQPEHKLGVFIAVNGDDQGQLSQLARDLLADLLKQKTGQAVKKTTLPAAQITQPSAAELQRYAGWYYLHSIDLPAAALQLKVQQGQLLAQSADPTAPAIPLQRDQDGWYRLQGLSDARIQLQTLAGREMLVAQTSDGRALHSERLKAQPLSAAWQQRIATPLQVGDLTLSWEVLDGLLLLLANDQPLYIIEPLDDQTAVVAGQGRGRGDVLRFTDTGVLYQGLGIENVRLIKDTH
ncbi:serine hydrolase [Chitinibacter tainanensis]|uniref:serine hydrolase domain-containing protein n=1 Tax=Chitinibacter tainanensis TaxID=230667 RepID=UPI00235529D0|nr:serine hydrolase domain-containing protein [Chitinibacter tainanensis]